MADVNMTLTNCWKCMFLFMKFNCLNLLMIRPPFTYIFPQYTKIRWNLITNWTIRNTIPQTLPPPPNMALFVSKYAWFSTTHLCHRFTELYHSHQFEWLCSNCVYFHSSLEILNIFTMLLQSSLKMSCKMQQWKGFWMFWRCYPLALLTDSHSSFRQDDTAQSRIYPSNSQHAACWSHTICRLISMEQTIKRDGRKNFLCYSLN